MLCVAGGKGGCGKTTTAVSLGRALVRRGRRPILVDADLDMPDLAHRLGVDADGGLATLAAGKPVAAAWQRPEADPGLRVVAGGSADALAGALRRLAPADQPVLVDTGGGADPAVATALRLADRTLVVTLATPASLEDTAKTAAMSRELDTPVAGAVVREPPGDPGPATPGEPPALAEVLEAPVLARLPAVEAPVTSHPAVETRVAGLTAALWGGDTPGAGARDPTRSVSGPGRDTAPEAGRPAWKPGRR